MTDGIICKFSVNILLFKGFKKTYKVLIYNTLNHSFEQQLM